MADMKRAGIGRYRLVFTYIMALLGIVFAEFPFLLPALVLIFVGMGLRLWAAGYITKATTLTRTGPYSLTRNPLYLGSFLSGVGLFVFIRNWPLLAVFAIGFAVLYGDTIKFEERFLSGEYKEEYEEYKRAVPRFLPNPFRRIESESSSFSLKKAFQNGEHVSIVCSLAALTLAFVSALVKSF